MSLSPFEDEAHIGNATMQTAASNNLVFTDVSSFKRLAELAKQVRHGGLYQAIAQTLIKLVHTNQTLAGLATILSAVADHAYAIRRLDVVGPVGQLLASLPLPRPLESVGHYYQALSLNRATRGDTVRAGSLFESVADNASLHYRAKAMLGLGTNSLAVEDHLTAMSFYREVMRIVRREHAFDPVSSCVAGRMTAVIRSIEGDHRGALSDLERMFPLARVASSVQPYAYYDYLNTLAVELGEVGRLEEARNASRIALASAFAPAYPEWRETHEEIELRGYRASRSVVALSQPTADATSSGAAPEGGTLVHLPALEEDDCPSTIEASPKSQPARVLSMQEWKKKVPEKPNDEPKGKHTRAELNKMSTSDLLVAIMNRISSDIGDDALARVLSLLDEIALENKEKP